jgi:hypothetical protein
VPWPAVREGIVEQMRMPSPKRCHSARPLPRTIEAGARHCCGQSIVASRVASSTTPPLPRPRSMPSNPVTPAAWPYGAKPMFERSAAGR